jgi:hypothetical protein
MRAERAPRWGRNGRHGLRASIRLLAPRCEGGGELEEWSDADLILLTAFGAMFVAGIVAALVSPSTDLRARAREVGIDDADAIVGTQPGHADADTDDGGAWFVISRGGGDDGGDGDGGDGGDGGD